MERKNWAPVAIIAGAILAAILYATLSGSKTTSNTQAPAANNSSNSVVTGPTVFLSPKAANFFKDSTFTVEVRENSGQTTINAVQASISYPADKLELLNVDESSSAFKIQAQNLKASGRIVIARGIIGSLSGDQLIAKLIFKATRAATIHLDLLSNTQLADAQTNHNLITSPASLLGATYTIR